MQKIINNLERLGFSKKELLDMKYLTECIEFAFDGETHSIDYFILSRIEADRLSDEGLTEKVRIFAKNVFKKLQGFESI